MKENIWGTGRLICAAAALAVVIACGMLAPAAPAAFADTAVASAATHSTPPTSPGTAASRIPAGPRTLQNCLDVLTNFGYYPQTPIQVTACGVAAKTPYSVIGAALCAGALKLTGVSATVSAFACTAGTAAGLTVEEWCYDNGGYACLNAWGGGPFVNAYTGGPETRDTNAEFTLIHNSATDYGEIEFIGDGSYSDDCIGDSNNNPDLADAGLVACGTASGNGGWGTNLAEGTNGCPSGEMYFFDSHWSGYLGPANNYVNGSQFFLNKPTPYCFAVTFEN
jgi:hypothetical protein